jgi:transcriptional regulator with XRE-family HTH domain
MPFTRHGETGQTEAMSLGEYLRAHELLGALRRERERQQVTLAQLAERTGHDAAVLSRLFTGRQANTTLPTLRRIANALGRPYATRYAGGLESDRQEEAGPHPGHNRICSMLPGRQGGSAAAVLLASQSQATSAARRRNCAPADVKRGMRLIEQLLCFSSRKREIRNGEKGFFSLFRLSGFRGERGDEHQGPREPLDKLFHARVSRPEYQWATRSVS